MVNTVNEHRSSVLRRSRHDNFLSASLDVLASCLVCQEETSRLNNNVSVNLVPFQVSRIHLSS